MKIQKSLHDQTTKRLLPLFQDIVGKDDEPRENSIIFARRAVTAQIKQVWGYTIDAKNEYNEVSVDQSKGLFRLMSRAQIVHGADEILDVAGEVENVSLHAQRGADFPTSIGRPVC